MIQVEYRSEHERSLNHWIGIRAGYEDKSEHPACSLVGISQKQISKHALLLGKTGSGKSVALTHLIAGVILRRDSSLVLMECDMGHVSPAKFAEKLRVYHEFLRGGHATRLWNISDFNLLTITTGKLRAAKLDELLSDNCSFTHLVKTVDDIGASLVGGWS